MLHITLLLNYNDGVRRCGAHYTDAPKGCKAPFGKNLKKFKSLFLGLFWHRSRALTGLSKPEISGFNTPMPN